MKRRTKFVRLFCLISLGGILGGALLGGVDGVGALDYQSSVGVGFTFNPSLNVSLSSSDLMISGLALGATGISNEINVAVSTNTVEGYTLSATVGNNSTYNGDSLYNSVDNTKIFANVATNANLASLGTDNTWGYSYKDNTAATPAWSNYNGLPLYSGTAVALLNKNDASSGSVDFKIAAKAGSSQASGEYNNVINFTAVSNTIPTTMLDAFIASGAKMHNGYFKMQDMTPTICKSIDTDGEKGMQLIDVRDDKVYWVAKLKDGNCWMTQNLDFDLSHETTLTSLDTDLNDGSKTGAYESDYLYDANTGVISWTPANTTRNYQSSTGTPWVNDFNVAYSLDPGEWYWDGDDSTANCNGYFTAAACKDHFTGFTSSDPASARDNVNKHLSVGNYYNWSAAIASDGSGSLTTSTYDNINLNPQNSICPKGWRLPTISNMSYSTVNSTSEFGRLNQLYNGGGSTDPKLISSPLWFVRSGGIGNGSFINSGSDAYYWSSTVSNSNYAYYLYFTATGVDPADSYNRYGGRSVRCVAR